MRPGPLYLLPLLLAVVFLVTLIQVGVISIAFEKLGLSPSAGMLLVLGSLLGSMVNVPLYRVGPARGDNDMRNIFQPWLRGMPEPVHPGSTVIAVNIGGCVIPFGVSLYLFSHHSPALLTTLLAIAIVSLVSYRFSRMLPGIGIGMPLFLAPLVSALTAILLDPSHSAPVAYISGTLGVLIGADLLRLREIAGVNVPLASVGGAGTFDGIFITGIVAALLA